MVPLQVLSEEYLLNLLDRFHYEFGLRCLVYEDKDDDKNPWFQRMYLVPMWNIIKKIEKFEPYFAEFNLVFSWLDIIRQPVDFSSLFPRNMIHSAEEEFIFKGQKIRIEYEYVI